MCGLVYFISTRKVLQKPKMACAILLNLLSTVLFLALVLSALEFCFVLIATGSNRNHTLS